MFREFKEFAVKGSAIDMAVGIIIGAAFGGVVKSLVSDVIMPPLGWILGKVDLSNFLVVLRSGAKVGPPYRTLADAQAAGAVTLNYGAFLNSILSFLLVSFAVFLLVRQINRFRRQQAPTTKECPFCLFTVPLNAVRCAHCTSELAEGGAPSGRV